MSRFRAAKSGMQAFSLPGMPHHRLREGATSPAEKAFTVTVVDLKTFMSLRRRKLRLCVTVGVEGVLCNTATGVRLCDSLGVLFCRFKSLSQDIQAKETQTQTPKPTLFSRPCFKDRTQSNLYTKVNVPLNSDILSLPCIITECRGTSQALQEASLASPVHCHRGL